MGKNGNNDDPYNPPFLEYHDEFMSKINEFSESWRL